MMVVRAVEPGTFTTSGNTTGTVTFNVIDHETARISATANPERILTAVTGVTSLFGNAAYDTALSTAANYNIEDNTYHLVGTGVPGGGLFPETFRAESPSVTYTATTGLTVFPNFDAEVAFISQLRGNDFIVEQVNTGTPTGARIRPRRRMRWRLGTVDLVMDPAATGAAQANHFFIRANGRVLEIRNSAGTVLTGANAFGAAAMANQPLLLTDGDLITATTYQYITDTTPDRFIIYPADRCSWEQNNNERAGYSIHNARFYNGSNTGTDLTDAELGYIGKSGRFVQIAG